MPKYSSSVFPSVEMTNLLRNGSVKSFRLGDSLFLLLAICISLLLDSSIEDSEIPLGKDLRNSSEPSMKVGPANVLINAKIFIVAH